MCQIIKAWRTGFVARLDSLVYVNGVRVWVGLEDLECIVIRKLTE